MQRLGYGLRVIGICLIIFFMCCADSTGEGVLELLFGIFVLGTVMVAAGTGCVRIGRLYAERSPRH